MKELSNDEVDFTWVNVKTTRARFPGRGTWPPGVADNDTVQNEADIQKKREVYALDGFEERERLYRYLQIPPMKETTSGSDKKRA